MKMLYPSVGLLRLCRLFGKTRQAFYDHNWRRDDEELKEALLLDLVNSIRQRLPKSGAVKLLYLLREELCLHHLLIGRDRFFALLKKHDLLIRRKKRYTITTQSNHPYKKWPDLTKHLHVTAPEQLWVSDITYLRTESGFIYLSLITDVYSRKIIGYHLSQQLKVGGCISSLRKALASLRMDSSSPVHHSDRGIQYCCEAYVSILQANGIAISMTQSGSPYDNAIAERVNGILKTEWDLHQTFASYRAAVAVVHDAIDAYNRLRPHMSIGNLTPDQAHHTKGPFVKTWKSKTDCKAKSVTL